MMIVCLNDWPHSGHWVWCHYSTVAEAESESENRQFTRSREKGCAASRARVDLAKPEINWNRLNVIREGLENVRRKDQCPKRAGLLGEQRQ